VRPPRGKGPEATARQASNGVKWRANRSLRCREARSDAEQAEILDGTLPLARPNPIGSGMERAPVARSR
jgi:hypothetical protein